MKLEQRGEIKSRRLEDELIEDMEWSPDPTVERERVERKAAARSQQEHFLNMMNDDGQKADRGDSGDYSSNFSCRQGAM